MLDSVVNNLSNALNSVPPQLTFAVAGILTMLLAFIVVKAVLHLRQNTAHTSFQHAVVAPVQYGSREKITPEDVFAQRLEHMVEEEEKYDLTRLMPKARELGSIAKTTFTTAPVLKESDLGVLALVEEVAQEVNGGFRVLVHASLDSLINLQDDTGRSMATRVSLQGVNLKLAVVDRFGKLIAAVDHMGTEPLGRQENINRTVVIEVLRKAGVWYLEIPHTYSKENAKAQLTAVLRSKGTARFDDSQVDDQHPDEGHQVA